MRVVFDGALDLAAWMLKPVPVTILDDRRRSLRPP